MMPNPGINRVRDLIDTDIFKAQSGTGTTAPTPADTALETAVTATLLTPTTEKADKSIKVTNTLNAGTATGSNLSEHELQINSGSTQLQRIVHTPLEKESTSQWTVITMYFFKRPTDDN